MLKIQKFPYHSIITAKKTQASTLMNDAYNSVVTARTSLPPNAKGHFYRPFTTRLFSFSSFFGITSTFISSTSTYSRFQPFRFPQIL
jgi:hypothetical protein